MEVTLDLSPLSRRCRRSRSDPAYAQTGNPVLGVGDEITWRHDFDIWLCCDHQPNDGIARPGGKNDLTRKETPLVANAGAGCVGINPGDLCVVCSKKAIVPAPKYGGGDSRCVWAESLLIEHYLGCHSPTETIWHIQKFELNDEIAWIAYIQIG